MKNRTSPALLDSIERTITVIILLQSLNPDPP